MPPTNKVLIVDDEADITRYVETGLRPLGYSVDTFNNPTKVLSL